MKSSVYTAANAAPAQSQALRPTEVTAATTDGPIAAGRRHWTRRTTTRNVNQTNPVM